MTLPASGDVATDVSDGQLLADFVGGDATMLAELVRRYEGPLYSFICRMRGSPDEASDLFQETFMRVCRHAETFRGDSSFKTWLYSIAANLCRSRLRSVRHERSRVSPLDDDVVDASPGPDRSAQSDEIGKRIGLAVKELPDDQREVIILRVYDRMSYREVAEVVGRPLGTVKSQMQRALGRLRTTLREVAEAHGVL